MRGIPGTEMLNANCDTCRVRAVSVCACLPLDEIALLEAMSQPIHLRAGDRIVASGQHSDKVFNVVSGIVRLYREWSDKQRHIIGFALPGDFIGLAMREDVSFSADAVGEVDLCSLRSLEFSALVAAKPHLLARVQVFTTEQLLLVQEKMLLLVRGSAEEKVVWFLLDMRARQAQDRHLSVHVTLPMSRRDIADFLGLTIETVSRTLTKLARERAIVIVPDGVRLIDLNRLEIIASRIGGFRPRR